MNFVKIPTFHKHLRSFCGAERKLVKKNLQKSLDIFKSKLKTHLFRLAFLSRSECDIIVDYYL